MNTINNKFLEVSVKTSGAELCSIKSNKTGIEYIWQADPNVWGSHAPNLFPIIGSLKEGKYIYADKEFYLQKHGFVRNNSNIKLIDSSGSNLKYSLKFDNATIMMYPFQFEFIINYSLLENTLYVEHKIINHGSSEMYFSAGGHPAFNCPLHSNEIYEDYYLEFENEENLSTWMVNANGLVSGEGEIIINNSNILPLTSNMFDNDALILKNMKSKSVSIKSKKSKNQIKVSFDGFPYLGIWAKPNSNFVCIEPWLGIADNENHNQQLTEKEGIINLLPETSFKKSYSVEIIE